jgi:hypothetical protein
VTYRLFIDDERYPPFKDGENWTIARSSEEAIHAVKQFGFPEFISFDHDLGGEDTSMIFINWMIDKTLDMVSSDFQMPAFPRKYYVHSQNPVGVQNIKGLMDSFIAYYYDEN